MPWLVSAAGLLGREWGMGAGVGTDWCLFMLLPGPHRASLAYPQSTPDFSGEMEAKRLMESAEPQLDEVKCSEGADLMPSNTDKDHCHLCEIAGSSLASTFWYGKGETVRSPWCSIYAGLLCTGTGAISPDAGGQNLTEGTRALPSAHVVLPPSFPL